MKKITIITATITATALFSCGNNGWDEATKERFITTCNQELSNQHDSLSIVQYCNCALEQTINKFPNQEDAINSGLKLHQQQEVQKCKDQFLAN